MNDLNIGCLIYDKALSDYGIIVDCQWTKDGNPTYRYYLIHWQNEQRFNINKEKNYKWPVAHFHNRIIMGEIMVF